MFNHLPETAGEFMEWDWQQIEPYYQDLLARPLDSGNVSSWLRDWTLLNDRVSEVYARLNLATTQDTSNQEAEARFNNFLDHIYPAVQSAEQALKKKLLDSALEPEGFEVTLRKMRAEATLFREANLPLLSEERKLASQYNKVIGAQTVHWEGEELTLQQLRRALQTPDREVRQRAWRLAAGRQLADREAINQLWGQFMGLRGQLASNAGLEDYRAYRWRQMLRLDYTPQDSQQFQKAIERVAVPAATRVYERRRKQQGLETLRPWDLDQDLYPIDQPPLPGYGSVAELTSKAEAAFQKVSPVLGEYFHIMREEGLLDMENRKGKAPGAFCTNFPVEQRPFILMNAVGLSGDIRTILHESGHAFHNFERFQLPYAQQRTPGLEFAEVASMSMELLASPYLADENVSLYSRADARRFRIGHLEHILIFWPYMAVVDAFQHWVYTHHQAASNPANCDARWLELWNRYLPGVDWSGLETEAATGWHRKQHIFRYPLYYVEYGLAQLGAVQVWGRALQDPQTALENYRHALSLGGTVSLPELYEAAGARLAFDEDALDAAVSLIEAQISILEKQ